LISLRWFHGHSTKLPNISKQRWFTDQNPSRLNRLGQSWKTWKVSITSTMGELWFQIRSGKVSFLRTDFTAQEINSGAIRVHPDFHQLESFALDRRVLLQLDKWPIINGTKGWGDFPLSESVDGEDDLEASGEGDLGWHQFEAFLGEPGWLSGFSEGDLVGVRVGIEVDEWIGAVPESAVDESMRAYLTGLFAEAAEETFEQRGLTQLVELSELLYIDLAERLVDFLDSESVVLAPLTELLEQVGASFGNGYVVHRDFDWVEWERSRINRITDPQIRSKVDNLEKFRFLTEQAALILTDGPEVLKLDDTAKCRDYLKNPEVRRLMIETSVAQATNVEQNFDTDEQPDSAGGSGRSLIVDRPRMFDPLLALLCVNATRRDQAHLALLRVRLARAFDPQSINPSTATFITAQHDQARAADSRNIDVYDDMAWEAFRRNDLDGARRHFRNWGANGGVDQKKVDKGEELGIQVWLRFNLIGAIGAASVARSNSVGRNDPCHCGSGRKYKQCCINKPAIAGGAEVGLRAPMLHAALCWFVGRTESEAVAELANLLSPLRFSFDAFIAAFDAIGQRSEIVEAFKSELLPAFLGSAEMDLLDLWTTIRPGLWEVVARSKGLSLTVKDVRTGREHRVKSDSMSQTLNVGQYVLTRPVPNQVNAGGSIPGDAEWKIYSGCVEIPLQDREPLLAMLDEHHSAEEMYRWVCEGNPETPAPVLHNTDGEELQICQRRWIVPSNEMLLDFLTSFTDRFIGREDSASSDAANPAEKRVDLTRLELVERSEPGEDPQCLSVIDARPFNSLVVGNLRISAGELELETNSSERFDVLSKWVTEQVGLGEPTVTRKQTFADQSYLNSLGGEIGSKRAEDGQGHDLFNEDTGNQEEPELDEATKVALRTQLENRWLSDSVPALGGLTPRQAANDPTRIDDLRRLLDSFERNPARGWFTYDVGRLRRELKL
jgi:hypothetical protein